MATAPDITLDSLGDAAPRRSLASRVARAPFRAVNRVGASVERMASNVLTALVQIWANKARSMLTTLGIIIAVTSTIVVVSFVQGFGNYVTDMLRGFGTNMIFVLPYIPGGMHGNMLGRVDMDIEDVRAVTAQCDKIRRITPMIFTSATIEYGREKLDNVEMQGASEQFQTIRNFFVDEGRFFNPIDVEFGAQVCTIGRDTLKQLEADQRIIGDYVFLNGVRFEVIGLMEHKGDMMGNTQDECILIPYTTAIKMQPFMRTFMPFVVEAVSEADVPEASLQITRVLRTCHNLKPDQPNDFLILRQDEFLRDFERIQMIATSVLAGIVGISLIVGGIGIMNVMLVSVTERTREIGLRKAVGARRRDILAQFLTEAMVLATIGGLAGIAFGLAICGVASLHPQMVDITVPAWVIVLAISFSAAVGVLFGIIPAFKAAILPPIDALRHE